MGRLALLSRLVWALVSTVCGGLCAAGGAHADGAVTLAQGLAGPYDVTVRVSPAQLRVGRSEWSVLVRAAPAGAVCLDCRVRIELHPMTDHAKHAHPTSLGTAGQEAMRSGSKNRVLHTASVDLATEGVWSVQILVEGADGRGRLDFSARVAPEAPLIVRHGWALAWPAIALALFGLHQILTRRAGPRGRSAPAWGSER